MASPHANLTRRYEDELRLFRSRAAKVALAGMVALWLLVPQVVDDDFWLSILNYAGIAAIGAIGLNLLTGYTGQVSLGHAFFLGCGAYAAAQVGAELDLPFPVWLVAAGALGAALGAAIGPFALRLRGNYLAIVTLGLVFLGEHLFRNMREVTGGNSGTSVAAPTHVGVFDVQDAEVLGTSWSPNQAWFWVIWALVALVALLARNIVRTRPGRAMQAVRDRDVAAEVVGVQLGRYKVAAFALSSALAAMAGALYGAYQQFVSPDQWSLFVSIQYIAIIIVGGVGTIFGSVLGALFLGGLPALIERYSESIPLVKSTATDSGIISVFSFNQAVFGVLIVLFLVFEPRGLAAMWLRVKAYFKGWPFSY
ncbi:MAG TPA: branched-chain amino acid ABC transporter permease [Solirubrobacteraceae bacterium]|jgi:branched-chain amino acid transport system permease protein|nr:branched-chain amino acid ABC transporter permease [Solirubrobacteraceae bacterium]